MAQKPELDRVDRALLQALSTNARASGAALAAEVGVAESTVSLRLRRLQSLGTIEQLGYAFARQALQAEQMAQAAAVVDLLRGRTGCCQDLFRREGSHDAARLPSQVSTMISAASASSVCACLRLLSPRARRSAKRLAASRELKRSSTICAAMP